MRLSAAGGAHLMYCTNVHSGERLDDVCAAIDTDVAAVKALVAPDVPFAVGLRLGAEAAEALDAPEALGRLRALLDARGMYVVSINGFPYGRFHGTRVKESVYRPDWLEPARVDYTARLARILAALAPAGETGSVSTVPGAFKARIESAEARERAAANLIDCAARLVRIRERSGATIVLALEPEPACMLETVAETAEFFEMHLHGEAAARRLADATGLGRGEAAEALLRHLGVCLDACHAAVEFEDPADAVDAFARAGISIAKMQLSAGLRAAPADAAARTALGAFAEDTYLHQTVARRGGALLRYVDLPAALDDAATDADAGEWRVHFHVPIFAEGFGALGSTRDFLSELLDRQRRSPFTAHLEVETYTWGVLPPALRSGDLVADLARELGWARERLAP